MICATIEKVTRAFAEIACVQAIVLGGSRSTNTATEQSDIDIGIYYRKDLLDYKALNRGAKSLDDSGRDGLVCKDGEWGKWVNFGAWLVVDGHHVDLIFRDWDRVLASVEATDTGAFSCHYQPGHPHAFLDVMYRGELASCKTLYAASEEFLRHKKHAQIYPPALKKALIDYFLFEGEFSCKFAEKSVKTEDLYYTAGQIFRAISALNQVLFALNEKWLLNEKKAVFRIACFPLSPPNYGDKVERIFSILGSSSSDAVEATGALCQEIRKFV